MIIAVGHNHYRWPGGEDQVFEAECDLLETHGHRVVRYTKDSGAVADADRLSVARGAVWSRRVFDELRSLFRDERIELVHFHNTFPLISPAAYYAARRESVAVVQTLHNFRLGCVNANLFRDGRVCEDCLGKPFAWPGVLHACYRGEIGSSALVASMVAFHRLRGTWQDAVDVFVALSESSRDTLIRAGLPADKLVVKPNFAFPDPGPGTGEGDYAVYVGRLSEEKGVDVLLAAWERLENPIQLKILGDGPLMDVVRGTADRNPSVEILGRCPREEVYRLVGEASFLVLPSRVYENCPLTVVEAFACGTPVVVSGHGAMAEMVHDGRTGLHARPGDADDLARRVDWLVARPDARRDMRARAREEFDSTYTAERSYEALMAIYARALSASRALGSARSR